MNAISTNNSSLSSILIELIEKFNISEAELARAIKLPRATINRIKSGKIIDPRSSTLTLISDYFKVSIDQLLGHAPISFNKYQELNIIRVPILEWSQLINIDMITKAQGENTLSKDWIYFECDNKKNSNSLFALQIEGDAMWPYFDDKSIIFIDTALVPQNRNFVVAYVASSDDIILRQLLIDGKSKILTPLNTLFPPINLSSDDKLIGVVAHVKKSF
jgi:SOS-response transcriptional repressor LexA